VESDVPRAARRARAPAGPCATGTGYYFTNGTCPGARDWAAGADLRRAPVRRRRAVDELRHRGLHFRLKDLNPGAPAPTRAGSPPSASAVYFAWRLRPAHPAALWSTDGTEPARRLRRHLTPGVLPAPTGRWRRVRRHAVSAPPRSDRRERPLEIRTRTRPRCTPSTKKKKNRSPPEIVSTHHQLFDQHDADPIHT